MSGDKPSCHHSSSPATASAAAARDQKSPSLSPKFAVGYEVNLPPSIPVSLDGEEGAYAYTQQLLQINADTKPECYQPPPNITIRRRLSGDFDDVLGAPFHSSSYTSVESTPKLRLATHPRTERHYVSDAEYFHSSALFASPRKGDPLPELPRRPSREFGSSGDYIGTSLFSAWRSAATSESNSAAAVPSRHHQTRSSSADSVRRLVKLKRFFVRKLGGRVPLLKQESLSSSQPTADATGLLCDSLESTKGLDKPSVGESPWDLPPNYVDMIFTRDPVTNENQSDVVENVSKLEIRKV